MGDLADVLVRVSNRSVSSNRARIAIGHLAGGPADDPALCQCPATDLIDLSNPSRRMFYAGETFADGTTLSYPVQLTDLVAHAPERQDSRSLSPYEETAHDHEVWRHVRRKRGRVSSRHLDCQAGGPRSARPDRVGN